MLFLSQPPGTYQPALAVATVLGAAAQTWFYWARPEHVSAAPHVPRLRAPTPPSAHRPAP